ncbi:MAG: RDD family protein [Desulfocapsaceae bacterium]|nr:RDD family protein [Desulfocapsaceae bacterium]
MQENPYAPPAADLAVNNANSFTLASRWKRFWAAMIDSLLSIIILVPIMYFTDGLDGLANGQENPIMYTLSIGAVGVVVFIILHGKLLAAHGQTIGKKILGIRIADLEGNLPSIKRHIIPRYTFTTILGYIPFIGGLLAILDMLLIYRKNRRCLHDNVAKTIVVYK